MFPVRWCRAAGRKAVGPHALPPLACAVGEEALIPVSGCPTGPYTTVPGSPDARAAARRAEPAGAPAESLECVR